MNGNELVFQLQLIDYNTNDSGCQQKHFAQYFDLSDQIKTATIYFYIAAVAIQFSQCPFAFLIGEFCFYYLSPVPSEYLLDLFASQSLIVLWTHPLHFISCQLVKRFFHFHFTSFHRNSNRWSSYTFIGLDPLQFLLVYLVQVNSLSFTAYAS